jgi:hypothetical protein
VVVGAEGGAYKRGTTVLILLVTQCVSELIRYIRHLAPYEIY